MSSVDNRIVSMKFDNAGFQRGVKETTRSLDDLKKNLQMPGASKGLDELAAKTSKFSFAGMARGLDNISSKFGIMGAIGFSVVQKLTQGFMDLAGRGIRAVLAPLVQGGAKRALTLEQAKFQFEGLGMDIQKTMASALEAVKGTAYGLDAAAKAASMFGASGMTAGKDMTSALRAISGVAAMTGSSYEDISQVFTTVAGNGRLMGTELLRLSTRGINAAATLGKSMGKSEEEVRKMVSEGKISFKMFYEAMDDAFGAHAKDANKTFSGSLANMKAALSRVGAAVATPAFEAMRKVLLALTDVIDDANDAMQPLIKAFGVGAEKASASMVKSLKHIDLSGFAATIPIIVAGIGNLFSALGSILGAVKDAFLEVFPPASKEQLMSMAEGFKNFTESLKMGGDTANNLKRTFAGVFAVFGIGWEIVKGLGQVFLKLFGAVQIGSGGILNFTGSIGDFLVSLHAAIRDGGFLSSFFSGLGTILSIPIKLLGILGGVLGDLFTGIDTNKGDKTVSVFERMSRAMQPIAELGHGIRSMFNKMKPALDAVGKALKPFVDSLTEMFGNLGKTLADTLRSEGFSGVMDIIQTGLLGGIFLLIRDFFAKGLGMDFRQGLIGSLKWNFRTLTKSMLVMQANIKAKTLMTIAGAIALLTVSVIALSMINPKKLASALTAMSVGFAQLLGAMKLLSMIGFSGGFIKIPIISASLILLSTAILILSAAVKVLSTMSWNELTKGLLGVAALLTMISLVSKPLSKASPRLVLAGLAMIPLAIGIRILASAVKLIGDMSWNEIAKGIIGLTGALVAIAASIRLMPKGMIGTAATLFILSTALMGIASAMKTFGGMSLAGIAKGMVGLGGSLVIIAAAIGMMPPNMIATAAALVIVGIALNSIARAMTKFGGMSMVEMAKSLIMLAGSLVILAAGLYLMSGTLPGAAALVVAAGAMMMLAPALVLLGSMSWMGIIKGLTAMAATFVIFGLAGLLLAPVSPIILALGAAVFLFGAGLALAGVGVLAFAAAMGILVTTMGLAGAAMTATMKAVIGLIPTAFKQLAQGIIDFVLVLAEGAPEIIDAMAKILISLANAVIKAIPKLAKAFKVLLDAGLKAIEESSPKIIKTGYKVVMDLLKGANQNINKVIDKGADIAVKFLRGIGRNSRKISNAGFDMIIDVVNGIADAMRSRQDELWAAGRNLGGAIINGMTFGLWDKMSNVRSAAIGVAQTALNTAMGFLGINSPSKKFIEVGQYVDEGFAIGIDRHAKKVHASARDMSNGVLTTVQKSMNDISNSINSNMDMSPTIRPVLDLSDIQSGSGKIGNLLDKPSFSIDGNYNSASGIAADQRSLRTDATTASEGSAQKPISFVQNNNSPKALSAVEIYRNTKNQLSMAKEALDI